MRGTALSPYNETAASKSASGKRVSVYDTTLRDGEQMPGVSFGQRAKVRIAEALTEAGVKHIEAGFPAVSERERRCVKAVARLGTGAETLALCRMRREDVDACADADADFLLMFVASSGLHLRHKYRCSRGDVLEMSADAMGHARSRGLRFSFSTEDSTRTELPFLHELNALGVSLGAERIGLTDTTGCASPPAMARLVREVVKRTGRPVSAHLHDDLGLALANALASLEAGATFFAATVNGIGERAGNLSLEQFCVASRLLHGAEHGVELERLDGLSKLVSRLSGVPVPPNTPIVGGNAFAHESGIHVAAVLREPRTYESLSPELVGGARRIIMGKHTGRALVEARLAERGLGASVGQVDRILAEVKVRGERNGRVSDGEFWRIVGVVRNGRA
jgi:isopropylmalate/homocitrate/citramalate synthase